MPLPLQWAPPAGLEPGGPLEPVLALLLGVAGLFVLVWWVLHKSVVPAGDR